MIQVAAHSPPFQGGVAARSNKCCEASLAAQTGGLVISNKIRIAARAYKVATRPFTNHPVCAAEERDLFIEAQPPLLEKEGNGLAAIALYILAATMHLTPREVDKLLI